MKKESVNTFDKGLNLDLHPTVTPNSVLTDNLNGTFITYNGNEFCLQNDKGNFEVAHLSEGYVPIGAKEYNGIIYIVSVKNEYVIDEETGEKKIDSENCLTEIGTYPGVDWNVNRKEEVVDGVIVKHYDKYEKEYDLITPESEAGKDNPRNCYTALCNFNVGNDDEGYSDYGNPLRAKLGYTTLTPVTIEIQPSYDGSVNLILTDGLNPVRIINSGFSVLLGEKYKLIKRNQTEATNTYCDSRLEEFNLIRTTNILTNIDLIGVQPGGQFKGGNYTFYVKFGDADYNQTDVAAESGIVSIFRGTDCNPSTISGTVLDERTDKMIGLQIIGLNRTYSKMYIYYSREYSDTLGYRMTEYGVFKDPIDIKPDNESSDDSKLTQAIWLTGYEQTETVNSEEIKIDYHTFDSARAEAQQQNMLFLGNLKMDETYELYSQLKEATLNWISTEIVSDVDPELIPVDFDYNKTSINDKNHAEYYSVQNIYNKVGYWPNEYYRFGVVFVLKDGSTTPVFNMRGKTPNNSNEFESNDYGVFKVQNVKVLTKDGTIKPIHFKFSLNVPGSIPKIIQDNVLGYFYVRQKRIPITLCQGLTLGIDTRSHLPVTWNGNKWITQSFLSLNRQITNLERTDIWFASDSGDGYKTTTDSYALRPCLQYYTKTADNITNDDASDDVSAITDFIDMGIVFLRTETFNSKTEADNRVREFSDSVTTWYGEDTDIESTDTFYLHFFKAQYWAQINTQTHTSDFVSVGAYGSGQGNLWFLYLSKNPKSSLNKILSFTKDSSSRIACWDDDAGSLYQYLKTTDTNIVVYGSTKSRKNSFIDRYIVYPNNTVNKEYVKPCALLSLDPCVTNTIRNILDGTEFELEPDYKTSTKFGTTDLYDGLKGTNPNGKNEHIWETVGDPDNSIGIIAKCVFVGGNTNIKEVDGIGFSNVSGSPNDISKYGFTSYPIAVWRKYKKRSGSDNNAYYNWFYLDSDKFNATDEYTIEYRKNRNQLKDKNVGFNSVLNVNVVRGLFTPFIGTTGNLNNSVYNIKLKQPDSTEILLIRKQDESEYFTVSNRNPFVYNKNESTKNITNVYRGDCFTNTVSMRIIRNFIDPVAPIADSIVDTWTWDEYVRKAGDAVSGDDSTTGGASAHDGIPNWNQVNKADVNTVDLGYWVTFKCLSSYNLGLRVLDYSNVDEMKLLGSPRSFYPLNGGSTATGNKMEESFILNDGQSATVGAKSYNLLPDVPYFKSEFANRIIFSNVQIEGAFTNSYRVFQGLSYHDYDKQYGAIVKLVPWDNNLLVVMEHGIGVVGVNEQALMQTSTTDTIHIYGHGVLSDHMQIISPDFGSKYEHSVIRTPLGVYGIDTDARKIWRFSTQKGFETLSDMKIESYLNDNMFTNENVEMEVCDVRTHYNATKGDIMFTFFKKRSAIKTKQPTKTKYTYVSTDTQTFSEIGESKRLPINSNNADPTIVTYGNVTAEYDSVNKELVITSTGDGNGLVKIDNQEIETKFISEAEEYAKEQEAIEQQIEEDSKPLKLKIEGFAACTMSVGSVDTRNVTINNKNITLDKLTLMTSDDKCVSLSKVNGKLKIKALKETPQVSVWLKYGDVTSSKIHIEVTPEKPFVIDQEGPITVIQGTRGSFTASNVDSITADIIEGKTNVDYVQQHSNLAITFYADKVGTTKFEVTGYIDGKKVSEKKTVTVNIVADIPITGLHWDPTNSIVKNLAPGGTARFTMNKGDRVTLKFLPEPYDYNTKVYSKTIGAAIEHGSFVGDHTITSIYCSMRTNAEYMEGQMAGNVLFIANKAGHCKYEMNIWKNDREKVLTYYFDVTVNE